MSRDRGRSAATSRTRRPRHRRSPGRAGTGAAWAGRRDTAGGTRPRRPAARRAVPPRRRTARRASGHRLTALGVVESGCGESRYVPPDGRLRAGPDGCVLGGPDGCVLGALVGDGVPGGGLVGEGVLDGLVGELEGGVLDGWYEGSPGCADELAGSLASTAAQYAATWSLPPAAVISTVNAGSSRALARSGAGVVSMATHRSRTFAGGGALSWPDVLGQALGEPPVLVKSPPGDESDAPAVISAGSRAPWSLPNEPRPGMCPVPAANAAPPPTAISATAAFAVASLAIATATIERFRVARPGERCAPRTTSTR